MRCETHCQMHWSRVCRNPMGCHFSEEQEQELAEQQERLGRVRMPLHDPSASSMAVGATVINLDTSTILPRLLLVTTLPFSLPNNTHSSPSNDLRSEMGGVCSCRNHCCRMEWPGPWSWFGRRFPSRRSDMTCRATIRNRFFLTIIPRSVALPRLSSQATMLT